MKNSALCAVALALVAACSTPSESPTAPGPLAPFPYTPEQIRDGNPPGTEMVYRLESYGADPTYVTTRFISGDATRTTLESHATDGEGAAIGEPQREESTWEQLQRHASFPQATTTRTEESYTTPAGTYECWLYTVSGSEEGIPWVKRLWFAKDKPGSPVYFEEEHGGQRMMSMTLIEFSKPAG